MSLPAKTWFDALYQCQQQGKSYVLVTLLATAGSTPRNGGTKMLVCDDSAFDTIGGGHLEFEVIKQARTLLQEKTTAQKVEHYPLSSKLGQCCGGATNVLFETFTQHTQHIAIYGAGHVSKALVPILAQLPLQISWIDNRQGMLDEIAQQAQPNNVKLLASEHPADTVATLPNGSWAMIMTHSHQLDFDLVEAALRREDMTFVGMIGSDTKARRFRTRLSHREFEPQNIQRLVSPVGLLDIPGKRPVEVAVSMAAQLIQLLEPEKTSRSQQKQAWRENTQLIQSLVTTE
ncbi:xanthine dehydrogenase accessory protein XdhC [Paraglaciecola sp. MB-3u-78]|uniref:xanthine dehydrogenase accessory protein XdhC n=1 Tax=Paraglaciecola sp. MB-3u-78 TaxID=2058332 RepID=UPI000C342134|nr:xanthine dehydrogenase accessory protein XdhC [Paraglaciecola sp. MB-3u-78]PKG99711.1 xanthine dehydrogenase accessory protein XdhC [Paraglaciecola sp. MB-3u-78]